MLLSRVRLTFLLVSLLAENIRAPEPLSIHFNIVYLRFTYFIDSFAP
jgi:hypothetical protein